MLALCKMIDFPEQGISINKVEQEVIIDVANNHGRLVKGSDLQELLDHLMAEISDVKISTTIFRFPVVISCVRYAVFSADFLDKAATFYFFQNLHNLCFGIA